MAFRALANAVVLANAGGVYKSTLNAFGGVVYSSNVLLIERARASVINPSSLQCSRGYASKKKGVLVTLNIIITQFS